MTREGGDTSKIFSKPVLVQDTQVARSGLFGPFCHPSPPRSRADKGNEVGQRQSIHLCFPKIKYTGSVQGKINICAKNNMVITAAWPL